MKKRISILMCIALLMALIPQQPVYAYKTTSLGTIVSGQDYTGETPTDNVGNHIRVRFEMPIEQDSTIRLIMYTQPDGDTSMSIESPNSPYEKDESYGSFSGSDLTAVNDFYNPVPNVFSTSSYGVTADLRNTASYTEVFGTIVKGTYYIVLSGATYHFKIIIEPLKYQGDNSNPNATLNTATVYELGTDKEGLLVPNGIINNNFINYQTMMNSWYKFTGKAGKYTLTFASDGFFQGTCSVTDKDGYPINGIDCKIEAFYEFNNTGKIGGTYEEHLEKARFYTQDFEIAEDGTYYININRKSYSNGSYLFNLNYSGDTDHVDSNEETVESEVVLEGIAISPEKATLKAGAKVELTATGVYSDKTSEDMTEFVTWISSNKKVATVDDQGNVKGVAAGTAKITASLEGKEKSITVTVTAAVEVKKIVPAKATVYLMVGGTATNKITAYYTDGSKKSMTADVTYKSSSSSLSISKKGLLKASAKGTYTVTVTYQGKKTTFKVVVK